MAALGFASLCAGLWSVAPGAVCQGAELPRRTSAFTERVWLGGNKTAVLPQALNHGELRYYIRWDGTGPTLDLSFDFETAMTMWADVLGIKLELTRVRAPAEADFVLSIGATSLTGSWSGRAQYLGPYAHVGGRDLPVIEMKSEHQHPTMGLLHWTSIPQMRAEAASGAGDLFGPEGSARETAEFIRRHHSMMTSGGAVELGGKTQMLAYAMLIHELGHAFGLADLYVYDGNSYTKGNRFAEPKYKSIMARSAMAPLYIPAVDRNRVRAHVGSSGLVYQSLCQSLLLGAGRD